MAQSDKPTTENPGAAYMAGPKPAAPIPRYEPGTDPALRDRLQAGSAIASPVIAPASNTETFTLAGIEGRIDRRKAKVAGKLVDDDPEQALRVIRHWLVED